MVGGTFGITGQKQYRNDLGQVPGYDKFAEDKKESSEEMFSDVYKRQKQKLTWIRDFLFRMN